jgi:hypothetical protein
MDTNALVEAAALCGGRLADAQASQPSPVAALAQAVDKLDGN